MVVGYRWKSEFSDNMGSPLFYGPPPTVQIQIRRRQEYDLILDWLANPGAEDNWHNPSLIRNASIFTCKTLACRAVEHIHLWDETDDPAHKGRIPFIRRVKINRKHLIVLETPFEQV